MHSSVPSKANRKLTNAGPWCRPSILARSWCSISSSEKYSLCVQSGNWPHEDYSRWDGFLFVLLSYLSFLSLLVFSTFPMTMSLWALVQFFHDYIMRVTRTWPQISLLSSLSSSLFQRTTFPHFRLPIPYFLIKNHTRHPFPHKFTHITHIHIHTHTDHISPTLLHIQLLNKHNLNKSLGPFYKVRRINIIITLFLPSAVIKVSHFCGDLPFTFALRQCALSMQLIYPSFLLLPPLMVVAWVRCSSYPSLLAYPLLFLHHLQSVRWHESHLVVRIVADTASLFLPSSCSSSDLLQCLASHAWKCICPSNRSNQSRTSSPKSHIYDPPLSTRDIIVRLDARRSRSTRLSRHTWISNGSHTFRKRFIEHGIGSDVV